MKVKVVLIIFYGKLLLNKICHWLSQVGRLVINFFQCGDCRSWMILNHSWSLMVICCHWLVNNWLKIVGWWKLLRVSIWKLLLNIDHWCKDNSQEFPLSLRDCNLLVGSCHRLEDVDGCCRLVEICRCLEIFSLLISFQKLPFISGRLSLIVSVDDHVGCILARHWDLLLLMEFGRNMPSGSETFILVLVLKGIWI